MRICRRALVVVSLVGQTGREFLGSRLLSMSMTCPATHLAFASTNCRPSALARSANGTVYGHSCVVCRHEVTCWGRRRSIFGLPVLPPESWVSAGFALVMLVLDMIYSAFIVRPPPVREL